MVQVQVTYYNMKKFLQSVLFWFIFTCAYIHMVSLLILIPALFILWIKEVITFWFFFAVYMVYGTASMPFLYYFAALPLKNIAQKSDSSIQKRFAPLIYNPFSALTENFGLKTTKPS